MSGHDGRALSLWYTTKAKGRTCFYYLSTRDIYEGLGTSGRLRLPAAELEVTAVRRLCQLLRALEMVEAMDPQALALPDPGFHAGHGCDDEG